MNLIGQVWGHISTKFQTDPTGNHGVMSMTQYAPYAHGAQCKRLSQLKKMEYKKQRGGHRSFFAARGGTRGSRVKVGGIGSHDLNDSPTKWPISGPVR